MSDVLDLSEAIRIVCSAAGIEPMHVRHLSIHTDQDSGGHVAFELVDGSAVAFLIES